MNNPINYEAVSERLIRDYGFKRSGKHMHAGKCPECGKKELYTHQDRPYLVKCNRTNNCGYEATIRDLYPDLYENLTKKVPATAEDPKATAKYYLKEVRGFNALKIADWFDQGLFHNPETNAITATVKFYLDDQKTRYWERLIDHSSDFNAKAHFAGKRKDNGSLYQGDWWQPPVEDHDHKQPLLLVEGIFDTIALWHAGIDARSLMSSNNYPHLRLANHPKTRPIVFALDNNKAGIDAMIKYVRRARDEGFIAFAAIPEGKHDWNELYQFNPDKMKETVEAAMWHGARLVAETAGEAAALFAIKTRKEYRLFVHQNAYWVAKYDESELIKSIAGGERDMWDEYINRTTIDLLSDDIFIGQVKAGINTQKISNCTATFEYQQVDQYNDQNRRYHFTIHYENGTPPTQISVLGTALNDAGSFSSALLSSTSGARFNGVKKHIEELHQNVWMRKQAKVVSTIDFVGYDKISKAYVYNDIAYFGGKPVKLNKQGFFESGRTAIKTVNRDVKLTIGTKFDAYAFMHHFQSAYAERGLVVLAWWAGSLFAEQLREHFAGYPFFELQGQASSGKSTLIKILWKLLGRTDYEGFNPLNSSFSAIDRNFSKVSNMPVVLIESDANAEIKNAKPFNWEHLKNAYTGEPLKERGQMNAGNETVFNPFRATLMAAQNTAIEGSEAILSRFVHLTLDRTHHLPGGKHHAETLARANVEELSGFLPYMLANAQPFIDAIIKNQPAYYHSMNDLGLRIDRIRDNHSMMAAMLDALSTLLPIDEKLLAGAHELIKQRAVIRQKAVQQDHPEVQAFWDLYEYLNVVITSGGQSEYASEILNHSKDDDFIAINLVHFEQVCSGKGVKTPDMREVKRHLPETKRHRFIGNKPVNSTIKNHAVRCFVFENKDKKRGD